MTSLPSSSTPPLPSPSLPSGVLGPGHDSGLAASVSPQAGSKDAEGFAQELNLTLNSRKKPFVENEKALLAEALPEVLDTAEFIQGTPPRRQLAIAQGSVAGADTMKPEIPSEPPEVSSNPFEAIEGGGPVMPSLQTTGRIVPHGGDQVPLVDRAPSNADRVEPFEVRSVAVTSSAGHSEPSEQPVGLAMFSSSVALDAGTRLSTTQATDAPPLESKAVLPDQPPVPSADALSRLETAAASSLSEPPKSALQKPTATSNTALTVVSQAHHSAINARSRQVNASAQPLSLEALQTTSEPEAIIKAGPSENVVSQPTEASLSASTSATAKPTLGAVSPAPVPLAATPSSSTQPLATASAAPTSGAAAQIEQFVEQVSEAREGSRALRPELTLRTGDFGTVGVRLEASASANVGDWRATLVSRDPGFIPAVQAALADRAVAAAGESGLSQNNASNPRGGDPGSSQSGFSTVSQGSNGGQDQRYGSSTGGHQGSAKPYSGEEVGSGLDQAAADTRDQAASGALNERSEGQGGALFA